MIKRVWGTFNNSDTILSNMGNGTWQTIVPFPPDGVGVISVYAEDEAGNKSFVAKLLYTVDPATLKVSLSVAEYDADLFTAQFMQKLLFDYSVKVATEELTITTEVLSITVTVPEYSLKVKSFTTVLEES